MKTDIGMEQSMSSGAKNVQTELEPGEYTRLRELAEAEGISIKEALRRATTDWIDRHDAISPEDPLFRFHEDYDVPTTGPTNAESIEAELYGP